MGTYDVFINFDVRQIFVVPRIMLDINHRNIQENLDGAYRYLEDIQFKLPGSEEMTNLSEVLKRLTTTITIYLKKLINLVSYNVTAFINSLVVTFKNIEIMTITGEVLTVRDILERMNIIVQNTYNDLVKMVEGIDFSGLNRELTHIMDVILSAVSEFNEAVSRFLQ